MSETATRRAISNPRRGGALLEFAFIAPILIYLLVAVADFSRYYVESSALGAVAMTAAQRGEANADGTEVETFCACPLEPDVHFACGQRACGAYGEPARYNRAVAVKPFSFIGRYPGFPRHFEIRRQAGVRTR